MLSYVASHPVYYKVFAHKVYKLTGVWIGGMVNSCMSEFIIIIHASAMLLLKHYIITAPANNRLVVVEDPGRCQLYISEVRGPGGLPEPPKQLLPFGVIREAEWLGNSSSIFDHDIQGSSLTRHPELASCIHD